MKKIIILGSTGSIGSQTLEVIRSYPKEFKVVGLACGHRSKKFQEQVKRFQPEVSTTFDEEGIEGLIRVATWPTAEMVVVSVVGIVGLLPTLEAIKKGKDIALATKEVIVTAGELIKKAVKKSKVNLIPLDSEHAAIFQCLHSGKKTEIKRIFLTMGKGKLSLMNKKELKKVKPVDVFKRKTWRLGTKIGVDSATCMNKSFEVIEAKWLFNLRPVQIEIIVHPEYLCHSLVEFVDGSIIGEFGAPDMRRYIQYALFYPKRKETRLSSFVDLVGKKISFEKPPFGKFPCLSFGFKALKIGGTMPAVMLGADESAVRAFLEKRIGFMDIPKVIEKTMAASKIVKNPSLSQIFKAEEEGERFADGFCCHHRRR